MKAASDLSNSTGIYTEGNVDGHKFLLFLPPRTQLSAWLQLQTAAFPTSKRFLGSAATCKCRALTELRTALSTPHNIKCSFCYVSIPEGYALHISVHITRRIIRADVSLCTALIVLNWRGQPHHTLWVGQCLKRWNLCRKMKTFRKLYSPTHAYSLMSPFMESPYWLNPPKYLYGIWVTATLALTLYAVGFFLLFYLWWHIKTIEKCENNAKNQPEKGQRWLNNRGKKKERKIAE